MQQLYAAKEITISTLEKTYPKSCTSSSTMLGTHMVPECVHPPVVTKRIGWSLRGCGVIRQSTAVRFSDYVTFVINAIFSCSKIVFKEEMAKVQK